MSEGENTEKEIVNENQKIEQLEAQLAAAELKARKSDNEIYSDEYLEFKRNRNKPSNQTREGGFSTGSRISDFTEAQLQEMSIPKIVELAAKEAYINLREQQARDNESMTLKEQKSMAQSKRKEANDFALKHPDLKKYIADIAELEDKHPTLNIEQLYRLAKKEETKSSKNDEDIPKGQPNTREEITTGVHKSDKNLSYHDIIAQEAKKLK